MGYITPKGVAMKKVLIGSAAMMVGCMLPQALMAGNIKSPLSLVQLDLKMDYINFVDSLLDRSGVDRSVYLGVEGHPAAPQGEGPEARRQGVDLLRLGHEDQPRCRGPRDHGQRSEDPGPRWDRSRS